MLLLVVLKKAQNDIMCKSTSSATLTGVHFKTEQNGGGTVAGSKYLEAPLHRLLWKALDEGGAAFAFHHPLVNGDLLPRVEKCLALVDHVANDVADCAQPVTCILVPVVHDFQETE